MRALRDTQGIRELHLAAGAWLESYCAVFLEYALRDRRFGRSRRARAAQLLDG
jgi:hypothetical protein